MLLLSPAPAPPARRLTHRHYQHQYMIVQLGSYSANVFFVTNRIRQGRILFSMLLNINIDGLSDV